MLIMKNIIKKGGIKMAKTKQIVSIDDDLKEWLKSYKISSGRSIEWTINQSIRDYMQQVLAIDEQGKNKE